jgi:phosphoglycolate phosphatase
MEKIILFDLDGTLIDSTDAIVETFYFTFEKMGFDFSKQKEDIVSLIGYPLEIMYEKLGVELNLIDNFVEEYRLRYREISVPMTLLLPNVVETLELASSFARLGIVTTKTKRYTIPLLENMKILKYFECIIGREDVENPKPHPEPILKAMEVMNITNKSYDIYMIGDTKLDLIAASKAYVHGIGVLCGHGKFDELSKYSNMVEDNSLLAVKRIKNQKK